MSSSVRMRGCTSVTHKPIPEKASGLTETALVGFSGFIGSALASQFHFDSLFNSTNIGTIVDRKFDLLVFAGAQSRKWWANQQPEADWAGIQKALTPLHAVSASKAVLIS